MYYCSENTIVVTISLCYFFLDNWASLSYVGRFSWSQDHDFQIKLILYLPVKHYFMLIEFILVCIFIVYIYLNWTHNWYGIHQERLNINIYIKFPLFVRSSQWLVISFVVEDIVWYPFPYETCWWCYQICITLPDFRRKFPYFSI